MKLNINNSDDPSYRYKMPKLSCQNAGRGNGSFTFLLNINDVSKSLGHPPCLLLKYIGTVLGAGTNSSKLSVTGHHKQKDLQKIIFSYIDNFVLCPKCKIPELTPEIIGKKKRKSIKVKCSACGYYDKLNGSNKYFTKGVDSLIKYLDKNEWKVIKGTMVEQKEENNFSFEL